MNKITMESKYTKAERRKIYLKAAKLVENNDYRYCCDAIRVSSGVSCSALEVTKFFPEFGFFEPSPEMFACSFIKIWWLRGDKEARIFALLLCAEMCND